MGYIILLIKKLFTLPHALWTENSNLAYSKEIVGFAAPRVHLKKLKEVIHWLDQENSLLQAYLTSSSTRFLTIKATAFSASDIYSLPYPESGTLDLSENENIIAEDIVNYYIDFINKGDSSAMARRDADKSTFADFNKVFSKQINGIYGENPLKPLDPYEWPGIICQPFVFGDGKVDWDDAESLKDKLGKLLEDQSNKSLRITRIARIYDGRFIFLLKPRKLRYWLKSTALRDADETLMDMIGQGF